jgi:hypothetical protein
MDITTLEMLRENYAEPKERAVRKEIRASTCTAAGSSGFRRS